jgi:voltage-gated potassium channel Kch
MTLLQQIFWGTGVLAFCLLVNMSILTGAGPMLRRANKALAGHGDNFRISVLCVVAIVTVVIVQTVQVWIWAASMRVNIDVVADWNTAVYFSLVTFTTLGYGDIILGENLRIFGSFAAVTGLLSFGINTALLVSVFARLFRHEID